MSTTIPTVAPHSSSPGEMLNFSKNQDTDTSISPETIPKDETKKERILGIAHAKPTKKALKRKEQKRQIAQGYKVNDTKATLLRETARDLKFNKNYESSSNVEKIVKDVQIEFQMFPNFGVLRDVDPDLITEIRRLNNAIGDGLDIKHGVSDTTAAILDQLNNTLGGLNAKIPDLNSLSTVDLSRNVVNGATKEVRSQIVDAATYGLLMYLLYSVYAYKEDRSKKACGTVMVVLCMFLLKCDQSTVTFCKAKICSFLTAAAARFQTSQGDREGHIDFQIDDSGLEAVVELVAVFIFGRIVGKAPEGKTLSTFFKDLGSVDRSTNGLKSLTKKVIMILEKIVNWVRVDILSKSSVTLVESSVEEVRKFVQDSMEVADLCHKEQFILNAPNGDYIHALWMRGNALLNKYSTRETSELRVQVQNQMTYITKVKARFEQANILSLGTRQVPLCVLIRGPSGVGKSAATVPLVTSALTNILPKEELSEFRLNYESYIYGRQAEHVYWDGYRGQFVCAFDDFGQLRDVAGQGENEFSEFIRAGNIFGFILHMADIESKGGVAFKSKICICTTNLKKIEPCSIVEPEAVTRRFDLVVDQVPPPEFCTEESLQSGDLWARRLDKTKVAKGFDEKACEYHEYAFVKGNGTGGQYTGRVFTFQELVDEMTHKFKGHEQQSKDYRAALDKNIDRCLTKRAVLESMLASEPVEQQMDVDRFIRTPYNVGDQSYNGLRKGETFDTFYDSVCDSNIRVLFQAMDLKNKPKSDLMLAIKDLKAIIGVTGLDDMDFLEQIVRGSSSLFKATNAWVLLDEERKKASVFAYESALLETLMVITKDPQVQIHVRESLRVSMKDSLYSGIKAFYECAENFLGVLRTEMKRVLAAHPMLAKVAEWIPFGENVFAFLIPAMQFVLTTKAIKLLFSCFARLMTFIIPGFWIPLTSNQEAFEKDMKVLRFVYRKRREQVPQEDVEVSCNYARDAFMDYFRDEDLPLEERKELRKSAMQELALLREDDGSDFDNTLTKQDMFSRINMAYDDYVAMVDEEGKQLYTQDECMDLAVEKVNKKHSLTPVTKEDTKFLKECVKRKIMITPQSETKVKSNSKSSTNYVRSVKAKLQARHVEQQIGCGDRTLDNIMTKVVENNSYEFWLGDVKKAGYFTFVQGRLAILPWHFVTQVARFIDEDPSYEDRHFVLKKARSSIEISVPVRVLLDAKRATGFDTLDMCVVQMPREVRNHIDITKYFHTEKMANKRRDKKFVLYFPNQDRVQTYHGESYISVVGQISGTNPEHQIHIRSGFRYTADTEVGDCGALMAAVDPSSGREKIIGVHTGGNSIDHHGFSTAVCYEDLMETLALFEDTVEQKFDADVEIDMQSNFTMLDGRFVPLGKCVRPVRVSTATAISRSRLHGKWGPAKTAPARLRPFEVDGITIDPFEVGLSKYCTPHVIIDTELMALIADHIYDDLNRVSRHDVEKRLLTFEEAVKGIENEPHYTSIPRGTSPGFPHVLAEGKKLPGKTKWFGKEQEFDLTNEECNKLRTRVAMIEWDAKMGIRNLHVFCDYLKDERRTHEKNAKGSTRIISACPLELTIIVRQYFGAWNLWFIKNKLENGSAVGVNPYSFDWHILAQKLSQHGPKCGAGDYSKFDGSQQPEMHWAILDIIQRWYDDGEHNYGVRKIIWEELVNSRHIRGDKVYEWVSSLPSGFALTTLINILVGFFNMRYAWFRAHNNDERSLVRFTENVYICELGDDVIFNFSDACSEVFNEVTISKYLSEIGFTYTDEDKKVGSQIESRPLESCSFLKRGFRVEKTLDRYVGPLDLDSILESPYWTTEGSQRDTITKTTFETSLLELSLHDKETFDTWAPRMIKAYYEEYTEKLDFTTRNVLVLKSDNRDLQW